MGDKKWNPRYMAYARSHGRGPEDQRDHDRKAHPGGAAAGYIIWIGQRWREWEQIQGRTPHSPKTEADHAAFDVWLAEQVEVASDG